ncbi:YceI family protein [Hylemonella gracilis]|uniref:YceI family protein n=1 Tax=Hylemonella gracilis TaxID=80880 RepID=A0A4P6UGI1_9BURK|nr:YceI family protein [Hylemonella gracilis]QBK03384.1 YceI family protein [Hylemonella gracilis]QBK06282.1 YceI family protein [Hylemonella gracilis]
MHFIRRLFTGSLLLALSVLASLSLPAQAQQKLLPAQSEIIFVSKQMGVPVEGYFKKFDAQIAFDPAKPQTSKIAFTVDMASATLGVPEADAELPKAVWFNVPGFPQARFQSTAIKALGAGKYEVAGQLTIKGRANPVTVPVTLTQASGTTTATGVFTIKRLAYAIGENQWSDTSMVADEVQVKFKLALTGVGKL